MLELRQSILYMPPLFPLSISFSRYCCYFPGVPASAGTPRGVATAFLSSQRWLTETIAAVPDVHVHEQAPPTMTTPVATRLTNSSYRSLALFRRLVRRSSPRPALPACPVPQPQSQQAVIAQTSQQSFGRTGTSHGRTRIALKESRPPSSRPSRSNSLVASLVTMWSSASRCWSISVDSITSPNFRPHLPVSGQ
jgi:hypothetical protein